MENEFITPDEAAALIGVTTEQLGQMRWKGTGPVFYKPNTRLVRYRRDEVLEWLGAKPHKRTDTPVVATA